MDLRKIVSIALMSLLISVVVEKTIGQQTFNLAHQQNWYSLKYINSKYFFGIPATLDFMFERTSLAGEKLNLSKWFGHHQIIYKNELTNLKELKIDFSLDTENSYLLVYLNCDDLKCWVYRASRNENLRSGFYLVEHDGRFIESKPLNNLTHSQLNQFNLRINNSQLEIFLNNELLETLPDQLPYRPLRLSSGLSATSVYKIKALNATANNSSDIQKIEINFSAPFNLVRFVIMFFILVFALSMILYFTYNKYALSVVTYLFFLILFFTSTYYFFDRYYYSHLYFRAQHDGVSQYLEANEFIDFEKYRRQFFSVDKTNPKDFEFINSPIWFKPAQTQQLRPKMNIHIKDLQIIKPNGDIEFKKDITTDLKKMSNTVYKIGFLGGSQTWGAGATDQFQSWPSLIIQELNKKTNRPVVGINFSECGTGIKKFKAVMPEIIKAKPNLLILNFGANDFSLPTEEFLKFLYIIQKDFNDNNIEVLYSIEAVNTEINDDETPKGEILRSFTKQFNQKLLNLHNHLSFTDLVNSGLIWNDQIHFTNYGHRLTADFFIQQAQLLESIKKH